MKGRQVRDCIVGKRDMRISRILYIVCVNGGKLLYSIVKTSIME